MCGVVGCGGVGWLYTGMNGHSASPHRDCTVRSAQIPSLEPATHIYAAWEGFARGAMESVGKLFNESSTAHAITIVQRSFRCVCFMG